MKQSSRLTSGAKIIGIACLSGGSGKTTTALNLAIMLSSKGKTLVVDFDPQGNLSQWLGLNDLSEVATIAEAILPEGDRVEIEEILQIPKNNARKTNLAIAPGDYSLTEAASVIANKPGRELYLKKALKPVLEKFDFIVIDSPPAKDLLVYNVILAADYLVIPTECSPKGVVGAYNTVVSVRELEEIEFKVPKILGIIPTRDTWSGANQTKISKAATSKLKEVFPDLPIFTSVRQSTVVQQANNAGYCLTEVGESKLAQPYSEVIKSILKG
jgi:chromosome partitioning protein